MLLDQFYQEATAIGHLEAQLVVGCQCLLLDAVVFSVVVGVDAVADDGSLVGAWGKDVEREFDIPSIPVRLSAQIPVATVPAGYNNITT